MRRHNHILQSMYSPTLIPALIQGLIIGAILVIVEISFASVIFSGPLSTFATGAAGMCIFGACALCLTTGLFSSFPGMVSLPQDTPVAILSVSAAAIMTSIPTASSEIMFATVMATMMASALVTGFFFWFIGKMGLSNFARFIPFPVMGGFLAGSGIMLVIGSLGVMTGTALTWSSLPQYLTMDMLIHWGPGVLFAMILFFLMLRRPHVLLLPGGMFFGMIIFFLLIFAYDISIPEARSQNWLLASLPSGQLWPVVTPEMIYDVDWATFATQIPNILTIALLSLVGMILNINGIELGARQDIDMDRELCVEATGNILGGLGGGFAGYGTLSLSMLGPRNNIISRIIPVTAALVGISVLCFGAQALTFIPKSLLGGLLFLLGSFFVEEWIISGWKRLTLPDYFIVLVIVLTIVSQGFLRGVALGLCLTTLIFIARFVRIPAIRDQQTLATRHSTRERSIPDQILLSRNGDGCIILNIAGYLFFGSAYFIDTKVKKLFEQHQLPERLILDLTKIQGFDISAVNTFQRIAQRAHTKGIQLSIASAPHRLLHLLKRNTAPEVMNRIVIFPDMDNALESAEHSILTEHKNILHGNSHDGIKAREKLFHAAADDLDAYLQEQVHFEKLMEYIQSYLEQKTVLAGETLIRQGEKQEDVIFVIQGGISIFVSDKEEKQRRIKTFGPGQIIAAHAAWGPWNATYTARAEHQAYVAILPGNAIQELEEKTSKKAMHLYRYMAKILAEGN